MIVVVKSYDNSYYYLYNLLAKKNIVKYKEDNFSNLEIDSLIIANVDYLGFVNDTNLKLIDILRNNKVNRLYIEKKSSLIKDTVYNDNNEVIILSEQIYYKNEIDKIKSIVLLKYILEDNRNSIFSLNFLILGNNNLATCIADMLRTYTNKIDLFFQVVSDERFTQRFDLSKYDCIINTTDVKVLTDEMLSELNPMVIFYDLCKESSPFNLSLLNFSNYKYRFINDIGLYYPIDKAKVLYELVVNNDSN